VTETTTSADSGSSIDSADASAESVPIQADSYDEGDSDYDSLPDFGEIDDLDEGDTDYDSLPDYGADSGLDDPELSYDDLPDPAADTASEAQSWEPGETVQVQGERESAPTGGSGPDGPAADAARGQVEQALDQGEREAEAREAVDAAYAKAEADGLPPNTKEQFEVDAQRAIDEAPTDTGAKQVEFKEPGPAKEVEFKEPDPAKEVEFQDPTDASQPDQNDTPEAPAEVHTPEEQRVVDDAKADLANREQGDEVLGGDPVNRADQWHQQGQNERGYENDCGVAAVAATARDCGVDVTESDVVDRAAATGLCDTSHKDEVRADGTVDANDLNGGTTGQDRHELLQSYGIDNTIEYPQSPEELAEYVEDGRGVITALDANEMWDVSPFESPTYYDADGQSGTNHAVQVTGTVRDQSSGELTGFVINDTGSPDGAGKVIPIDKWDACWTNTWKDHETVVTAQPTRTERAG